LVAFAEEMGVENASLMQNHELIHEILKGTAEGHLTRDTSSETVQAALAATESEMEGEGEMPPKRQRRPNGIFGGS
jgi:hypothetical protein